MLPNDPSPPTDAVAAPDLGYGGTDARRGHMLPIVFTGSGSEYFRIWSVNLLLTLVTLGLYHPWAKVRRLRYFYGNTLIGDHPLDFHGEPRRMLRGFLLVGVLVGLYSLAGSVSPGASLAALVIVAAVWPALFRAAQQFRLANTSWRGLRFHFTGGLWGAYRAILPLFLPGLIAWGVVVTVGGRAGEILAGLFVLVPALLLPLLWWLVKKYQHDHYALGQVQTQLRTGPGSFYGVLLKTLGVSLLSGALAGAAIALLVGGSVAALFGGRTHATGWTTAIGVLIPLLGIYVAMVLVIRPYATSRLQNLVWNRTQSTDIRFESALRFWPLVRLTLKNWSLVLVTLGLYWPFAAIATTRMRLQAMTVHTRNPPDELVNRERPRADDASGDAAGDLFGIDVGL